MDIEQLKSELRKLAAEEAAIEAGYKRGNIPTTEHYVYGTDGIHIAADELLLAYIGDAEVKEIFDSIEKYYD